MPASNEREGQAVMKCLWAGPMIILLLSACTAAPEGGTLQNIHVRTEPDGARCTLFREGETIGVISTTPGSATIATGASEITVICNRTGWQAAVRPVQPGLSGANYGSLLRTGGVGPPGPERADGHHRYPTAIGILLTPVRFPSSDARDRHLERRLGQLTRRATATKLAVARECEAAFVNTLPCQSAGREIDAIHEVERERLQREHRAAGTEAASSIPLTAQPPTGSEDGAGAPSPPGTTTRFGERRTTCAEQATRSASDTLGCLTILESTVLDVYPDCRSPTYVPTSRQWFREGDQILIRRELVGGYNIEDITCYEPVGSSWAYDERNPVIIIRAEDRTVSFRK